MSRKKNKNRPKSGPGTTHSPRAGATGGPAQAPGSSKLPEGGGQKMPLLRIAQLLFLIAFGISGYLAYSSLTSSQLAGCGTGSSCDNVLTSRWAYWFGLPVSVPAFCFYLVLLGASAFAGPSAPVATQKHAWNILVAGAFAVLAAALWFVGLQAVILKAWCKYCTAAHLLGGAGAALVLSSAPFVIRHRDDKPAVFGVTQRAYPAVLGMLALLPLVVGQYMSEARSSAIVVSNQSATRVEESTTIRPTEPQTNATAATSTNEAAAATEEPSRIFTVHDRYRFNLYSVPLIGNPEAPHVMVSLFDYTCSHCRNMHERLNRVQNLYSNELAIVLMPMPLDASCNPLLSTTGPDHVNACDYARIALALFKENEDRFNEYEDWFFETPKPRPIEEVRQRAAAWADVDDFQSVVKDPGIEAWIKLGIQVFQDNFQKSQQRILPMVMAGPGILAGEVSSDQALIDFLVQNLGLPEKSSNPE